MPESPLIIAHRGDCGHLPEHTLESYARAIDLGVDAIETDVVMTRDGHLVCRHDCELSLTTNVADKPEFASRRALRTIDGLAADGWFIEDFTLAEFRTLRARERFAFRDHALDDHFGVVTLAELLAFAAGRTSWRRDRPGVIIEIKHADYFQRIGLPMDASIEQTLKDFSLARADAPAWIESFEVGILQRLRQRVATPIIQLLDTACSQPADVAAARGIQTYGEMISQNGLAHIAQYASAVGPWKRLIVPSEKVEIGCRDRLCAPTSLIADAHAAGLKVHAWTFRDEPVFLAEDYGNDPGGEYQQFATLGLDAFITDFPATACAALRNN